MENDRFSILDEASKSLGEHRDCAVKAVAIVTGHSYKAAHHLLAAHGRKPRSGTSYSMVTAPALKSVGYKMEVVNIPGKTIRTLERSLPRSGNFLIHTAGHILAASDGKVHDWTKGRLHRVKYVTRVIPSAEVKSFEIASGIEVASTPDPMGARTLATAWRVSRTQKTVACECGCEGKFHELGMIRVNRMRAGTKKYLCNRCKQPVVEKQ